jgi:hypothetical protein
MNSFMLISGMIIYDLSGFGPVCLSVKEIEEHTEPKDDNQGGDCLLPYAHVNIQLNVES